MRTDLKTSLDQLNSLPGDQARSVLLKCCGSQRWAEGMIGQRPFASLDQINNVAERIWWSLQPRDWLEAFRSHPKIGEQKTERNTSDQARTWSEQEQSGMDSAADETKRTLATLNRDYEERFGYIFIVCATGKTSGEMLLILKRRLNNGPEMELRIAAAEQAKITALRLQKLLNQ